MKRIPSPALARAIETELHGIFGGGVCVLTLDPLGMVADGPVIGYYRVSWEAALMACLTGELPAPPDTPNSTS